jgi:hypothetical protein
MFQTQYSFSEQEIMKKKKTASWYFVGVEPQRGQYFYAVRETAEGEPWIAGEPAGDRLKIIGTKGNDLEIGFTLRPGTTDEQARMVAGCKNDWIVDVVLY